MKLKLVEPADTTAAMGTEVSCGNAGQNVACRSIYTWNLGAELSPRFGQIHGCRLDHSVHVSVLQATMKIQLSVCIAYI